MKKTVILCFIHGFKVRAPSSLTSDMRQMANTAKGDEKTFGDEYRFAEHLRGRVARALPKVNVKTLVYPTFETRGDLGDTVSRFRSWSVASSST